MRESNCPKCGLPITSGHICISKSQKRAPPELAISEDSEICAEVDTSALGLDGRFRPIIVLQEEGEGLALTVEDAQRLYDFLDEAIPFLEGKIWQNN